MIIGSVIVIFGVLLLFQHLGLITYDIWGLFFPLAVIVIGLAIATKKGRHHRWWCCCKQGEGKEEKSQ